MRDLKAHIERGDFDESPASKRGRLADCIFCCARGPRRKLNGKYMILNGEDAGTTNFPENDIFNWDSDYMLRGEISEIFEPHWLPPLSLRWNFVIDEAAVWFCNSCLIGPEFQLKPKFIATLTALIWQKRLPITPSEFSGVLMAHGMPSIFQQEFEDKFGFGQDCLIAAKQRYPLKKRRRPGEVGRLLLDAHRHNR